MLNPLSREFPSAQYDHWKTTEYLPIPKEKDESFDSIFQDYVESWEQGAKSGLEFSPDEIEMALRATGAEQLIETVRDFLITKTIKREYDK